MDAKSEISVEEQAALSKQSGTKRIIAHVLILTGMIPFIVSTLLVFRFDHVYEQLVSAHPPNIANAAIEVTGQRLQSALVSLLVYGAVILSFLGGARWGVEIGLRPLAPKGSVLFLSVLGALGGWALALFAIMVKSSTQLFAAFAVMFALHLVWDLGATALPRWFKRLRWTASLAAMGSMLAVALLFR